MRVLALDTTTAAGSVAIVDDDRVLVETIGDATRSHAERLPGDIFRALERLDLAIDAIDVFAIASGPGTFTGLRIGIATVQGLAFVNGRRVVPVSALSALAAAAARQAPAGTIVGAWMDAHRRDVFSALFRTTSHPVFSPEWLEELDAPAVGDPSAIVRQWESGGQLPDILVGDGTTMFAAAIPSSIQAVGHVPLAGVIGHLALARARRGDSLDPAAIQPLYIRRPDAEIARDSASHSQILKS